MSILSFDELKAGMILASDLIATDGRMLFNSGTELEERHLELLKRIGVEQADVKASPAGLSKEL